MGSPPPERHETETLVDEPGMSLRDYFAARAMQGLVQHAGWNGISEITSRSFAVASYHVADAMIKARRNG